MILPFETVRGVFEDILSHKISREEVAMDKAEKKRLQQELRKREKQAFTDSLPMPKELFKRLFDCLDERQEVQGCNHTLDITLEFLKDK